MCFVSAGPTGPRDGVIFPEPRGDGGRKAEYLGPNVARLLFVGPRPGVFRPEHIVDRCHHVAVCALIEARIPCGIGAAWGDDDNLGPSRGEVAAAIGGARLDEQGPALR